MQSVQQINHVLYINLLERVDRNANVLTQLESVGLLPPVVQRFNAIKSIHGALGCSASHLKCLRLALNEGWEHVLICEDDIVFKNPELFVKQFNKCLSTISEWDVIMLGGNNVPPYQKTSNDSCVRISRCLTTTGYLVKREYFKTLIENIQAGIQLFMSNMGKPNLYAIDVYWSSLQLRDNWLLITPLTVTQQEGYSDIEKRDTNYSRLMFDLDKSHYNTTSTTSTTLFQKTLF